MSGGSSSSTNTSISNEFDACTMAAMAEGKIGLRVVKYHESFNSCSNLGEFLEDVIDDSPIVDNITFGKIYVIKFGIALWVRDKLVQNVATSILYSVSFDDSHNA